MGGKKQVPICYAHYASASIMSYSYLSSSEYAKIRLILPSGRHHPPLNTFIHNASKMRKNQGVIGGKMEKHALFYANVFLCQYFFVLLQ